MANPQRFAQLVLAAFEGAGLTTDAQIYSRGGPSSTYMTGLRKAAEGEPMKEPRSDTYRRIERAALWADGSARLVWNGGEPEPSGEVESPAGSGFTYPTFRVKAAESEMSDEALRRYVVWIEQRLTEVERRLLDAGGKPATVTDLAARQKEADEAPLDYIEQQAADREE